MTVVDLTDKLTFGRFSVGVLTPRIPAEIVDVHPERDLLRTPAGRHSGWPVVVLDGTCALLGILLGILLLPAATSAQVLAVVIGWPIALMSTRRYSTQIRHHQVERLNVVGSAFVRLCAIYAILTLIVAQLPIADLVALTMAVAAATGLGRVAVAGRLVPPAGADAAVPVLVRGPLDDVERVVDLLGSGSDGSFRVAAVQVQGDGPVDVMPDGGSLVLAHVDPVEAAIGNRAQAVLLVGSQSDSAEDLRRMVWRLEGHGISTHMIPIASDLAAPSAGTIPGTGLPLLSFQARDIGAEVGMTKVVLDKVLALFALVVFSPIILATAAAVRVTSSGPALFRQTRVGRGGRPFVMLKFRTMYLDAEARRAELVSFNVHDAGTLFKIKGDPRITPVGRIMRKFSLDELPQLVNVLKGEMSLVGPRPPLPDEVENYTLDAHRRFRVRPGLTGLWQVSGRSDLDPEESVRLDTHYVEQWSIGMDAQILARTPGAVISGRGAY